MRTLPDLSLLCCPVSKFVTAPRVGHRHSSSDCVVSHSFHPSITIRLRPVAVDHPPILVVPLFLLSSVMHSGGGVSHSLLKSQSTVSVTPAPSATPLTLTQRLQAQAWKPPHTAQAGPTPQALDATFPFQVCACEMGGSLCSPLMLSYRDTSTILYRVQQHCRKIVPDIITHQTRCLDHSRHCQRGILDVTDSLTMIETLNVPVQRSFQDIVQRSQHSVALLRELARSQREEQKEKEETRQARINAQSSSMPVTPSEASRRRVNTAASSLAPTPLRRAATTPSSASHPNPSTSPSNFVSPRFVSTPVSNGGTPSVAAQLRGRLSGVFSPTGRDRTNAPPVVQEEEEDHQLQPESVDDPPPHLHQDPTISAFVP